MGKRILVVGGVAAGASCAARLRRLDEHAEIVMFERGPYVSFASCGLPYHVGDVIHDEQSLILVTPGRFREQHGIDVRTRHEVNAIDRERSEIRVTALETGETHVERYDALVLATGAAPVWPGFIPRDLDGVFTLRTVPETARMRRWVEQHRPRRAAVLGAGFIGLEIAENLTRQGVQVALVEREPQVLAPLDPEMAHAVAARLRERGVELYLGAPVSSLRRGEGGLDIAIGDRVIAADLAVLGLGIRPEVALARAAGLEIGPTGGIRVDAAMRTSDARISAIGDVVEVRAFGDEAPQLVSLAGPASRQGRVAADAIVGRDASYDGVLGTAIVECFGLAAAATGMTEKKLRAQGRDDYGVVWLHPTDHVSWFPGASTLHLKLIYGLDGKILGAQAVGESGVDKRIDVIATAVRLGATVHDLERLELAYAPQYGAPRDPVNLAGMIAANFLKGDLPHARWEEVPADALLVDVREPKEFAAGAVPGAINLPLSALRDRCGELPRDREIWLYCLSGKRSYQAARALLQRGFRVRTISGGLLTWRSLSSVA